MTRGRLCVLSRAKGGGEFYHLQYRKDTKLHQRYVSRDKAPAYKEASEAESPADFIHKLKVAQKELKESRVWLLFAARLFPGDAIESLLAESRELLLMIGKSINTASARMQGKAIGA